jgi:hypothetical protein
LRFAAFPKLLCYLGFGKSYLIPFTQKFDIGEGIIIINNILEIWLDGVCNPVQNVFEFGWMGFATPSKTFLAKYP